MKEKIVIGTRGSNLALWQANYIKKELEIKFPDIIVEIKIIKTTGDIQTDKALSQMNTKGIFIKEIEDALLNESIDIAVHSLKDMPSKIIEELEISGFMKRHSPNDVLILNKNLNERKYKEGLKIGCGSLRRINQFKKMFPKTRFSNIRGNIETRINKVQNGEFDGTILTLAALERLELTENVHSIFSIMEMVPAIGQGIVCIENRKNDIETKMIIAAINSRNSNIAAVVERSCMKELGGGCSIPLGIHCIVVNKTIDVYCYISDASGNTEIRKKYSFNIKDYKNVYKDIIKALKEKGVDKIIETFK